MNTVTVIKYLYHCHFVLQAKLIIGTGNNTLFLDITMFCLHWTRCRRGVSV